MVTEEGGNVVTLMSPERQKERECLDQIKKKCLKNFARDDMLKCIPVMWHELNRLKSRVQSVIDSLSNKTVQREKMIEFKKALVSNKSLKSYFEEHPDEKDILLNDISKISRKNDRFLFKNLDVLPPYVIPESIMALTQE